MKSPFLKAVSAKNLLFFNAVLAVFYFFSLLLLFPRGNLYLFWFLIGGEVFHVWQLISLIHAAWEPKTDHEFDGTFDAPVDIFITVAGEPVEVVEKTVRAALAIDYPNFHVYILNDGRVAKKANWKQIAALAKRYPSDRLSCITRVKAGGAKAGNINNALAHSDSPFVAVLDCDHRPLKYFLKRMVGYFIDERVGFVQSPQYYANHGSTYVANAAWQQQTLFFGPLCRGKDHSDSVFMCGTNMVIRRRALEAVGGMNEKSITEDILTSLLMHNKGWKSVYVPRILAEGMAPEDLGEYWKQQFRWARGSLEVLMKYNPLFLRGLTWQQRIQYLASVTFYLTGLVVVIDASLPFFYLYAGLIPVSAATLSMALIFVPYIFLTLYLLQLLSNYAFSFRAIAFSIASWPIYLSALIATVFRAGKGFHITSKEKAEANFLHLAILHIAYITGVFIGIGLSIYRHGISASLITNASWAILYVVMFLPFIRAAIPDKHTHLVPGAEVELPAEELTRDF